MLLVDLKILMCIFQRISSDEDSEGEQKMKVGWSRVALVVSF